jgi:hypothetical protein
MGREKPSELLEPERFLLRKWNPYKAALRKQKDANRRLSALILRLIETDPEFYQVFKPDPGPEQYDTYEMSEMRELAQQAGGARVGQ